MFKVAASRSVTKRAYDNDGIYDADSVRSEPHSQLPDGNAYLPAQETYVLYHQRNRGYIDMVLAAASDIPTVDELRGMTVDYEYDTEVPSRLPYRLRTAAVSEDTVTAEVELSVELTPDEEELVENIPQQCVDGALNQTIFDANNITPDNVLWEDLNATDTIVTVSCYAVNVGEQVNRDGVGPCDPQAHDLEKQQEQLRLKNYTVSADGKCVVRVNSSSSSSSSSGEDVLRPVQLCTGAMMVGDGSPTFAIWKAQCSEGFPSSDKLYNSIGGFHTYLEMWRQWGLLFRDSHLELLVGAWRDSPGKLQWFLAPGDPRQCEEETEEYLLAHYLTAIRACSEKLRREDVTVEEVEEFMLQRAAEHTAVYDVLLGIRWVEVMYMMRDSEASNDWGLFQQAQHLATLLWTITHAIKYVRIHMEERNRWAHASDMEKLIQRLYMFTKKTRLGKPIWADRCMEWYVKEIRRKEGKFWHRHKRVSVETTVLTLPQRVKWGRAIKLEDTLARESAQHNMSAKEAEISQRPSLISNTFKSCMLTFAARNIWGPEGPPKDSAGKDLSAGCCLAGAQLNPAFLSMMRTAEERTALYAATYHVPGGPAFRSDVRSEAEVNLKTIRSLSKAIEADAARAHRKIVELDPLALEGKPGDYLLTKQEILDELDEAASRTAFALAFPSEPYPTISSLKNRKKQPLAALLSRTQFTERESLSSA
ncbi:hypothetical protein B484DRAFT_406394 [Ochromonadaceae sp. CCMP2298]|nr:hypothetical protein B484DRAFT_406394 [Ochromonadaceae sp. CCMP2298]